MATYKGGWLVLRYWMHTHLSGGLARVEYDGPRDRPDGEDDTYRDGYVGMWFPRTLYPDERYLPVQREEIAIWP